jgi:glycosyltransferase involved in cell wall biosynthesis
MLAQRPSRGTAAVWYGFDQIPTAQDRAVGGIVKLQHLVSRFPNATANFNVVYLVSSRLPEAAEAIAWWARRRGARLVVNQNGVAYPAWYGPGWERVNQPMATLLACADHVLYQSEFCRASADRFAGRAGGSAEVLYNAVDTNRFSPAPSRTPPRPLVLLLAGSQDQWYRFDAALRTLACLVRRAHDVALIVTGRLRWSPDQEECRRQAEALIAALGVADRVTLTGPYSQDEAPDLYRRADILLHTKYNDPCPAVVIEALACGLPVVYSASGGVPELVGDDAGVGAPVELSWERDIAPDPAVLADGVEAVCARMAAYREAARQRAVDRFDITPWVERHTEVFEGLAQ